MCNSVKKTLFIIYMLVSSYLVHSQVIDARMLSETNHYFITKYVAALKSNTFIPIDSVLTPNAQTEFRRLEDRPVIYPGYNTYYYWFRFIVKNNDTFTRKLMLLLGPLGMRDAELFQGRKDHWKSLGKTGNQYAFIKRPYQYTHYVYPIVMSPLSLDTFYLYMDYGHEYRQYAFVLMSDKALKVVENRVYFFFGILIGSLLLFSVFNLYLFFSMKEEVHFWYALYILFMVVAIMKNDGLDEQFLGFDSEDAYRMTPFMGFAAIAFAVLMHVVQLFLTNILKKSLLFKVTAFIKWNLLLSAITHFIVFYFQPGFTLEIMVSCWTKYSIGATIIMILINCIYSLYNGFKAACFILIGLAILAVGTMEKVFDMSDPAYLFPPALVHIGIGLETIVISFGLMYRYKIDREEVNRRIVEAHDEEQNRIAEDLHDELGSNLSTIKIYLESLSPEVPIARKQQENLINMVNKANNDVRRIAHNLMPPDFENTTLHKLLSAHINKLNQNSNIRFKFYHSECNIIFTKQKELMIYKIILELTNNILKHSGGTEATVQLLYYDNYLQLLIDDNGKGINNSNKTGIGLKNVESRVNYLKGIINIDSGQNGTTIIIQIPLK
jgi:signal transduction histidine kinase